MYIASDWQWKWRGSYIKGIRYSLIYIEIYSSLINGYRLATYIENKESASILSSKVQEICTLIPALGNEIIWDTRGTQARTSQTKDSVIYTFKNGSTLENIAATEKSRGRRFQSGLAISSL